MSILAKTDMAQTPKVSIGMPVYNGAAVLRDALDSLLAQTFTDFELIISDNASSDSTEVICRKYAKLDRRIRYFRQAENRGPVPNFLYVLNKARGTLFMWAAADDLWHKEFLRECEQLLSWEADLGMVMTAYECVSRASRLFNLRFDDPLACIEISDRECRLHEFSKMSFATHKDNLVYSVWKKDFLRSVTGELESVFGENMPIGCAMNELALYRRRGGYLPRIRFYKRYRYFPPGHWLGALVEFLKIRRNFRRASQQRRQNKETTMRFLSQLETIMTRVTADEKFVASLVALNRQHLKI